MGEEKEAKTRVQGKIGKMKNLLGLGLEKGCLQPRAKIRRFLLVRGQMLPQKELWCKNLKFPRYQLLGSVPGGPAMYNYLKKEEGFNGRGEEDCIAAITYTLDTSCVRLGGGFGDRTGCPWSRAAHRKVMRKYHALFMMIILSLLWNPFLPVKSGLVT